MKIELLTRSISPSITIEDLPDEIIVNIFNFVLKNNFEDWKEYSNISFINKRLRVIASESLSQKLNLIYIPSFLDFNIDDYDTAELFLKCLSPSLQGLNFLGLNIDNETALTYLNSFKNIQKIAFFSENITDTILEKIPNKEFITDLDFSETSKIKNLSSLVSYIHLNQLNLNDCSEIDLESLKSVNNLPIEKLSLNRCIKIDDETLEFLSNFKFLTELKVDNNINITEIKFNFLKLKKLSIRQCENIKSDLFNILKSPIEEIDLSFNDQMIDEKFRSIENFKNLVRIHLDWCKNVNEELVLNLLKSNPKLEFISLRGCENISPSIREKVSKHIILDLEGCG